MSDLPPPIIYTGPTGAMRSSPWLSNEDIPHDRDVLVTIEEVHEYNNITFQGGRKEARVFALKFAGKERVLKVNAGHRKTLNDLTGKSVAGAWVGLRVYLWVEQNVRRPDGTFGPAVRIRKKRAPAADAKPAAAPQTATTDPVDEYDIPQDREPGDEP